MKRGLCNRFCKNASINNREGDVDEPKEKAFLREEFKRLPGSCEKAKGGKGSGYAKIVTKKKMHSMMRCSVSMARSSAQFTRSLCRAYSTGLPLNEGPPADAPTSNDRQISPKIAGLVEEIANLSLLDVSDLNWALKKRLNIPDTPMMAPGMMFAAAGAASAAAGAEEKQDSSIPQKLTFAVKLAKFDESKKIALIKEIRAAIPGLNLVQAKKFVETAPVVVKEDLGKTEAEELKGILEKAGATIEIV
ncbi:hypothetical protein WR25_18315 isoform A [Diploscapter pachys]|uniref:Ribosomal protein L7/L12 C-terminal domain-containing protein n=1 Tax=Diploscapter pachys TaxID=2018661 RepID=A0A2A2L040_9BILA|nr:hypothetical protein WR25_18315 isoform A [Diploscapter pachys]